MSEGRRVGIVAPTTALPGGHAVQAARLLEAWRGDPEFELRLVPIDPPPPRWLAWTSRVRYLRTLLTQLRYWRALWRVTRGLDVLHVFCTSNGSFHRSALPAMVVARARGVPVVANYRGDATTHLRTSVVARRLLRGAAATVAPSRYFGDVLAELGIPARVIPNVADLARFRHRARTSLAPRLVSTRNFEPIYDVACTLRAFAIVQRRHPDASLVVVGDGSEAASLRRLSRALGLRHVAFAGRVPQARMFGHYDRADVYVQTPTVDNFPGSLVEAFACGLPVVATAVGGVPCLLEHGTHGLLAPPGDHEAVAAAVLALLDDPARARRMAAAAHATCARYAAPVVRDAWREVYRAVTASRADASADEGARAHAGRAFTAAATGAALVDASTEEGMHA